MTPRWTSHERVYRWLLRLYPVAFRDRFGDELTQLFDDQLRDARTGDAAAGIARTWLRTLADLAVTATAERVVRSRTVAHSLAVAPPLSSRVLGLAGIVGGATLLVALFATIPPTLGVARIALFHLGAVAVVVAVHRRLVTGPNRVMLLAATVAIIANVASLAWTALGVGGGPDVRSAGAVLAVGTWLADAAFGLALLRFDGLARWGALALAIGSLLAILGIDRLGLTSAADPTIFGTMALTGVALSGLGWIVLGGDVATRRRGAAVQPEPIARD